MYDIIKESIFFLKSCVLHFIWKVIDVRFEDVKVMFAGWMGHSEPRIQERDISITFHKIVLQSIKSDIDLFESLPIRFYFN